MFFATCLPPSTNWSSRCTCLDVKWQNFYHPINYFLPCIPESVIQMLYFQLPSVTNYFDREVKRLEYIDNRKVFHDENKRKIQAEEAAKKVRLSIIIP